MTAQIEARIGNEIVVLYGMTEAAARTYHFDTRAHCALHSTLTGESMATWGPRYIKEAKAILALGNGRGSLWARVSEGRKR